MTSHIAHAMALSAHAHATVFTGLFYRDQIHDCVDQDVEHVADQDAEVVAVDVAEDAQRSCIQVAAQFVAAQPGGITRILDAHQHHTDGTCTGCLNEPTPWPCTTVTIAHRAQHILQRRAPRPVNRISNEQVEDRQ